jgi:flagellar protein FliS
MGALRQGELEAAHKNLLRVQDIVCELMASLDLEAGEVAGALYRIYEYGYHLLLQANVKKEIEPLYQVEKILLELREAWQQTQL